MNAHFISNSYSSELLYQLQKFDSSRSYTYYDNVFASSIDKEKVSQKSQSECEMLQDWNTFGIINPLLVQQISDDFHSFWKNNQKSDNEEIQKEDIFSKSSIKTRSQMKNTKLLYHCEPSLCTSNSNLEEIRDQHISFSISQVQRNPKSQNRVDAELKGALRFVKKYLKNLFKSMNPRITNRRYINCTLEEILEAMRATLSSIIPQDLLADDLVYYTVGILSIRKYSELGCKQRIKKEITMFNEANKSFTFKKLKKCMQESSLWILCRYIAPQASGRAVAALQKLLDIE
ncbi:unnamed protein product [Moneuplotes crassus]|uniref:Uncharacterized protein n=1 Tax=Euplotes crassus TaxID=5936 RepID=A0AAD1UK85_EUPCR|nr:unnamed protein product [Moneuplotes crassus]